MRIGIDISQLAYEKTGVANYLENFVLSLTELDKKNEYILFFSSLRGHLNSRFSKKITNKRVKFKFIKIPPLLLDIIWNKFHILPIEDLIGDVDIFISSDWTQPPTKRANKATIIYDLIVYKYPEETHNRTKFTFKNMIFSPNIVASQKRRLSWVKKECDIIFCISESAKKDAEDILGIDKKRLRIAYPGV